MLDHADKESPIMWDPSELVLCLPPVDTSMEPWLVFMTLRLWNRLSKDDMKLKSTDRIGSVICDEGVQAVECNGIHQVIFDPT